MSNDLKIVKPYYYYYYYSSSASSSPIVVGPNLFDKIRILLNLIGELQMAINDLE